MYADKEADEGDTSLSTAITRHVKPVAETVRGLFSQMASRTFNNGFITKLYTAAGAYPMVCTAALLLIPLLFIPFHNDGVWACDKGSLLEAEAVMLAGELKQLPPGNELNSLSGEAEASTVRHKVTAASVPEHRERSQPGQMTNRALLPEEASIPSESGSARLADNKPSPTQTRKRAFLFLASYQDSDTAIDRVERQLHLFTTSKKRSFTLFLKRSGKYLDTMQSILKDEGLPEDLAYLPLIESGYNTAARSKARAVGPWQFISATAKKYDLKIDYWRDERRDPIKSTIAAARYLEDLYYRFESWPLSLAAYNAGEGKVRRAIFRSKSHNYWNVINTNYLKRETRDYVSKFIAAGIIASDPEKYGFSDIAYYEPMRFVEKKIELPASLSFIARCANTDVGTIRDLNPELKRWCTPPYLKAYMLRIPEGAGETFMNCFNSAPAGERMEKVPYIVKKGDTLYDIAKKYRLPRRELYALNSHIKPRRLRPGAMIYLPPMDMVSEADTAFVSKKRPGIAPYRVKKGDTLYDIAKKYRLPRKKLYALNRGVKPKQLRPGMILYLPQSAIKAGTVTASSKVRIRKVPYIIKKGDTLYDIAKKYRIPRRRLYVANKGINPSRLKPGEKIYLPVTLRSM